MDTEAAGERSTPVVTHLGNEVFAIDTQMSGYEQITAAYLIRGDRPCLVETGTATSAPTVVAGLGSLGVSRDDLASIVVTHVHLDHAGGAGDLAQHFPRCRVHASEIGLPHLVDPSRLMASARRVFGRVLDEVFGLLRPVAAAQVVALADGAAIDVGAGRRLEVIAAPGHARHHVGLLDSDTGDLYVGDAAGVYIPETGDLRPATPPPDFDMDQALHTLGRFRIAAPRRLLFSHYGPADNADEMLARSEEELKDWVAAVTHSSGTAAASRPSADACDLAHVVDLMLERARNRYDYSRDDAITEKVEHLSSTGANVGGVLRWLAQQEAMST